MEVVVVVVGGGGLYTYSWCQSHFNVSLIVMDKVTGQCPQTTTFEEKGYSKRIRTEVHPLTSLTPYR